MNYVRVNGQSYVRGGTDAVSVAALPDERIILSDDMPVYRFIDAAGFDSTAIHRIRVARPVSFACGALLKSKATGEILFKPENLDDLLLFIDEKELKNYRLVLNTEDRELLSETIQQLFYLDIDMEVMLRREEKEVWRMDLFDSSFDAMISVLNKAMDRIRHCSRGASGDAHRERMLCSLSYVKVALEAMHARKITVAVMALKKSGKSAVVNCLLGEEYTPASLETPTFRTCIYRRSTANRISLTCGGREIFFDSPGKLKSHLMEQFKKMHSGEKEACACGDMQIRYLPGAVGTCDYTVIDTPGPDLAGTDHREIAYTWIREADVILFIIDYSKYLTTAEEEFLGEIKRVFEEFGKFYSLIVVVNKLDLMYMSDGKKSALRFTDFLRAKLKELGYRGFVVIGVSALQYLYSLQVTRMSGCEGLQSKDGKKFRENLNQCLVRYQGTDEMTVLSFLDTQIRNMRWFHGRKNATLRDLKDTSGFKQLMKYINHVAVEKAHFESFNHKMQIVEQELTDVRDNYLLPLIGQSGIEAGDIEKRKGEIERFGIEAAAAVREIALLESDENRIMRDLKLARKSLMMSISMQIDTLVRRVEKTLEGLSGPKLDTFMKNGELPRQDELSGIMDERAIEKLYVPVLGKYAEKINRKTAEKGKVFAEYAGAARERIAEQSGFLLKDYPLGAAAEFVGLPSSFYTPSFSPITLKMDPSVTQPLVSERLVRKRGLSGALLLIVSLGMLNTRTGRLKFNDVKLRKALLILRKDLERSAQDQMDALHKALFSHISTHLAMHKQGISAAAEAFITELETVCRQIIDDADMRRNEIEAKTELLVEMRESLEEFSNIWDTI